MAKDNNNVLGQVEDATEAGFAKLLLKANEVAAKGLTMIGVVNIGTTKIGGVFVRLPKAAPAPKEREAALLGEDGW